MKYARNVANTAVDVRTESPEGFFTPEVVAVFIEVPEQVQDGWQLVNGQWQAPPVPPAPVLPPPAPVAIPTIGPIAFQLLFTGPELVAADAAQLTDPYVRVFWKLLDDPRTDVVDRNLSGVQASIQHLEDTGIIGVGRAEEIIHGTPS